MREGRKSNTKTKHNQSHYLTRELLCALNPLASRDPCPLIVPAALCQLHLEEEINQELWESGDERQKARTVQSKHGLPVCLLWFKELLGIVTFCFSGSFIFLVNTCFE